MKACIVGGNWNNNSNAGAFALNLNNARTNSNNNVGGRDSFSNPDTPHGDTGKRGMCRPAISEMKQMAFLSSNVENQSHRLGNLFTKAFSEESLYLAYLDARRGKRKKRGTYDFEINLGNNIRALYQELMQGEYMPKPYRKFEVYEPKKRIIYAPHFRDLVVQHAIYRTIYDLFNKSFIDHSFACRKGGGTHKASQYTQREMRKYSGELYSLKLDIRKFFYRIDRDILKTMFEKKIKDKRFVEIMMLFTQMNTPIGIPIGNLLTQLYALIYLNPLDHFIKRELKVKSYVRYVDDFVVIGVTLDEAKTMQRRIIEFLHVRLNLELSYWIIQKIKRGINFVGYRTWRSKKIIRKYSMIKFIRAVKKKNINVIVSLIGHAKHSASLPYFKKILIQHEALNLLPKGAQQCLNTIPIIAKQ